MLATTPIQVDAMSRTSVEGLYAAGDVTGDMPSMPIAIAAGVEDRGDYRPRPPMKRRATSPLADALARVGDRWTLLVVAALLEGPKRFNELQDELDGIAPNVLSLAPEVTARSTR